MAKSKERTKFVYNENVKIIKGFYRNNTGKVKKHYHNWMFGTAYIVNIDNNIMLSKLFAEDELETTNESWEKKVLSDGKE